LARTAIEELESQVLVLDDGFQHRRLGRDLDIVLLDALEPFGLGRIFPRGLLREPINSLRRADVVVLSRADLVPESRRTEIRAEAQRHAGELHWVEAAHCPIGLLDAKGNLEPLPRLANHRVAAFCGIGNPEGFRRTIEKLGVNLVGFRAFPDHHPYSGKDVAEVGKWAESVGADLLLTTQKDSVKLRVETIGSKPLRALKIGLEILKGDEDLKTLVGQAMPAGF
jgi:tetraacyldisaccharide 4'-kinase